MEYGLISVFGAGLLTFLTPCVLPIIPIYLAVLADGAAKDAPRGRLVFRALMFAVGFTFVFATMGLGASALGTLLRDYGGWVQLFGAFLVLVFALKFLGLINIPLLDRVAKADDSKLKTRLASVNALIMGVVFAAGWSPCVGPVLGSVLTYTATASADPLVGAGYLSVYGAGFALPLLITAAFAEATLDLLSRLTAYLPRIERAIGILMLAVAGYLATNAYEQLSTGVDDSTRIDALANLLDQPTNEDPLPVMVEFYTPDCTVCKEMKSVLNKLVEQCDRNGVRVKTIDISAPENRHYATDLGLVGVPTFVFIDEFAGESARLVGRQTELTLKQALSALRGQECPGITMLPKADPTDPAPKLAFPKNQENPLACDSPAPQNQPGSNDIRRVSRYEASTDMPAQLTSKQGCKDLNAETVPSS